MTQIDPREVLQIIRTRDPKLYELALLQVRNQQLEAENEGLREQVAPELDLPETGEGSE